jgi:hypothetical protein
MNRARRVLVGVLWLAGNVLAGLVHGAGEGAADGPLSVRAVAEENRIVVRVGGELFTAYRFGDDLKYPHFYPVNGPLTGRSVTAVNTEPWPHHSSLFLSCDRVGGNNYWQPFTELKTGQIKATAPRIVESTGKRVVLSDVAEWAKPGDEPQLRDTRTVTITAPSATVRVLDFQFDFHILQDLLIQKTGHSLFSARMNPTLAVAGGGTMVDSEGNRNEEGTRGKTASWCACYGPHPSQTEAVKKLGQAPRDQPNSPDFADGCSEPVPFLHSQTEGLAIMQHSGNPFYPAPWFSRNYGFFSPTPVWLEDRQLQAGDRFTKRYRVVVFAGDHQQSRLADLYDEFERLYRQ